MSSPSISQNGPESTNVQNHVAYEGKQISNNKVPPVKISIPGFIENTNNDTASDFIYWAGFCVNGKEGINSLKIVYIDIIV